MRRSRRKEELELVNLCDHVRCPQCGRVGRVVWISQDGKEAGIRCPGHHSQLSRGPSQLGSAARPETKSQKNMVFLMETNSVKTISSAQR